MSADILLVDDDPSAIQLLGRILAGEGTVRFATKGADAVRLASTKAPDLVLLDAELPDMNGFQVCTELKRTPGLEEVPVIFVTSHRDESFEVKGFDVGAVDFIAKPVNPKLVLARVRAQLRNKRMADALRLSATTDALTGLANRRRFEETLEIEWRRSRRSKLPLALLLVDVDHFKLFNDTYGHPEGDTCLHAVATALKSCCLRPADTVARYGGEEFALLLPETPNVGALHVAERVLSAMAELAVPHGASPTARVVTVSVGVATNENLGEPQQGSELRNAKVAQYSSRLLLQAADRALYQAKASGRARACSIDIPRTSSSALHGVEVREGEGGPCPRTDT